MGFPRRINNIWRGFFSTWVSEAERQFPEGAYENALSSLAYKFAHAKRLSAALIRRRQDLGAALARGREQLEQVRAELANAVKEDDEELGVLLLQKEQALAEAVQGLEVNLAEADKEATDAKSALVELRTELVRLKSERDSMLAKLASAQARLQLREQLDGLSVDAELQALDNVREHIKNVAAEATLANELAQSDVDIRLHALRKRTQESQLRAKWAQLRGQSGA